jgi:hypothetical protein
LPAKKFNIIGIHLSANTPVQEIAGRLGELKTTFHLFALDAPITDAIFAELAQNPVLNRIQILKLNGVPLTDRALEHLVRFKSLAVFEFAGATQITDQGLKQLAKCPLAELRLYDAPITDQGLDQLKELKGLGALTLLRAKVTAAAVKRFAEARPNCRFESDHGAFGPPSDPDRKVAEWVLSIGGIVTVHTASKDFPVPPGGNLPAEPYRLS